MYAVAVTVTVTATADWTSNMIYISVCFVKIFQSNLNLFMEMKLLRQLHNWADDDDDEQISV